MRSDRAAEEPTLADQIADAVARLEAEGLAPADAAAALGFALTVAAPCRRSLEALPYLAVRAHNHMCSERDRADRLARRNDRLAQLRWSCDRYARLGRRAAARAIRADLESYRAKRWAADRVAGEAPAADPDRTFHAILEDGAALIGVDKRTLGEKAIFAIIGE